MSTTLDPLHWLERHGDLLYRFALSRVGDQALAEDLVQETLLAAWKAREDYCGRSSESTWLVGILRHKIIDYYRKQGEISLDALGLDLDRWFDERGHWCRSPGVFFDPQRNYDVEQLRQVLQTCVSLLPPRFRHLFYLREVDGLSAEEIRKQLPVSSTNNVWVMLSRMRFKLRQCLERAGFDDAGKEEGE